MADDSDVVEVAEAGVGSADGKGEEELVIPDVTVQKIVRDLPNMTIAAGPRDAADLWKARLKEELKALIQYVKNNKAEDNDWFRLSPQDPLGLRWAGSCWYYYKKLKYEFRLEFELPATYPVANPDLVLPELEGKTAKMYRGGKICLSIHFQPLWARSSPRFGIVHALALGLGPWLAAEVPHLVDNGLISKTD